MIEVRIMQGEEVHTYFTESVVYRAVPVDDGTCVVMLECVPRNGTQRGKPTFFPFHRIVSVTEKAA